MLVHGVMVASALVDHLKFTQFVALSMMINLSRQRFYVAITFGGSFKVYAVCRFVDDDEFVYVMV